MPVLDRFGGIAVEAVDVVAFVPWAPSLYGFGSADAQSRGTWSNRVPERRPGLLDPLDGLLRNADGLAQTQVPGAPFRGLPADYMRSAIAYFSAPTASAWIAVVESWAPWPSDF